MFEPAPPKRRRPARPKYQVFISSTKKDLWEARREVTWEVLKARHIPAGMETFPVTHDRGWLIIQDTIDGSDYYMVIVAGRYGTVDSSTGVSWTEREYQYAKEKMTVLAFVREMGSISGDDLDKGDDREKLDAFREKLKDAHHCGFWTSIEDLRAQVAHTLQLTIQDDEDKDRAPWGYYRGDQVPSGNVAEELARLSAENVDLRARLSKVEAGKELLVLTAANGDEFLQFSSEGRKITVVESAVHDALRSSLTSYGHDRAQVQLYANDAANTVWIALELHNRGGRPARNVVADFTVTGGSVFIEEVPKPGSIQLNRSLMRRGGVQIDDEVQVKGGWRVRQRVSQVAVGGFERLIEMGFRPRGEGDALKANVHFHILSEDGVLAEGDFEVGILIPSEIITLTVDEALGEFD